MPRARQRGTAGSGASRAWPSGCSEEHRASDVVVFQQVSGAALEADLSLLEEDRARAQLSCDVEALLNDENRHAVLVEPAHDLEQLTNDDRRQTERQLVDAENVRVEHQRLGKRELLLLPTRQAPGKLRHTLAEARERR